jgi:two-component system CheB/CheR fusion protein
VTKPSKRGGRERRPAAGAKEEIPPRHRDEVFPIVGIGASAGGLRPSNNSWNTCLREAAWPVSSSLDPTHKGVMPELLQRATPMEVIQVKDRTVVQPDHVYVIPSTTVTAISSGVNEAMMWRPS